MGNDDDKSSNNQGGSKTGILCITVVSAEKLKGGRALTSLCKVHYADADLETPSLAGGPTPKWNHGMEFEYKNNRETKFTVVDLKTSNTIGEGTHSFADSITTEEWSGKIALSPSGFLHLAARFIEAPTDRPRLLCLTIASGTKLQGITPKQIPCVKFQLAGEKRVAAADDYNGGPNPKFNKTFQIPYNEGKHLVLEVSDQKDDTKVTGIANYHLWHARRGGRTLIQEDVHLVSLQGKPAGTLSLTLEFISLEEATPNAQPQLTDDALEGPKTIMPTWHTTPLPPRDVYKPEIPSNPFGKYGSAEALPDPKATAPAAPPTTHTPDAHKPHIAPSPTEPLTSRKRPGAIPMDS